MKKRSIFSLWHSHFETEVRYMVKTVNKCTKEASQSPQLIYATLVLEAQDTALSAQSQNYFQSPTSVQTICFLH